LKTANRQQHNATVHSFTAGATTMGLLDSVLGSVLGGASGGGGGGVQGALLNAVVGMLTQGGGGAAGQAGGGGGLGGLGGLGASLGGLGGLMGKLDQAGLGDVAKSWVGTGANQSISPDQLGGVLGNDMVSGLAKQLGLGEGDVLGHLSQMLPQVVDKLTPNGQMPQLDANGGMGNLGDIAGMLGGLLKR
jgi:uncharacterized protein YidB (DUF937 family)